MMKYKVNSMLRDDSGAAAIEFAIYSSIFFGMLIGGIYASMLGFASASLHNAVEAAARCRSMGITCTDATTTQSFAASKFYNVTGKTATFASTPVTCGNQVTGSVNYKLNWILSNSTIPLTAKACFPSA